MSQPTYFIQPCPTCGRRLEVRVEHLGKEVVCQHCRARFNSQDPETRRFDSDEKVEKLLRRAEALLRDAAHERCVARTTHPR